MDTTILAPAAVLVAWSLVMLGWLAFARFGKLATLGSKEPPAPGLRGQDIDPMLGTAAWKSHNYAHLMEQPTLFYATVVILHIVQAATPLMIKFAWAYVALRIIHSVYQATINKVMVRFSIFMLSTICLVVLAVNAVIATL
ncbi:MAG TPA: MAPEG family protein [Sphingorhabdus sp.]|nr:MAPEG family protein [Sphingorhabdus sp.]